MNKLGFYMQLSLDQNGLWEAIRRVQPPVILIHADTANTMLLQEIRRFRAPDAFVICRMFKDGPVQQRMLDSDDPEGQGRVLAEEIIRHDFGLASKRGQNNRLLIDAWMSLNEPIPGPASKQFAEKPEETARRLRKYDRFQVAFRARLQEAGLEAVAFNFGAGNFSAPEHYLEYFPGTLESYTYLGFHEYGWPTLCSDAGSATSGGSYRACMEGIRARYGNRHRVIITEAGLTRMHQNTAWGDVGWLNHDAPLSEEEYWKSLAWYNEHMSQDDYVLGACLYQVGHHGLWETFRHLGRDNAGHDLHLVDRIVALRAAPDHRTIGSREMEAAARGLRAAEGAEAEPAPEPKPGQVTIRGKVTANGAAVRGASVRLFGSQETLAGVRGAAGTAGSSITWTCKLDGVSGTTGTCWRKHVAGQVAGLTRREFDELVRAYNPALAATGGRFRPEGTYFLPENKHSAEIAWDRPLAGFSGTTWQCWQQHVENKVADLTYNTFKRQITEYNPGLKQDGGRFLANQRYNLPRNAGEKEYTLFAVTGRTGRFAFTGIPAGEYRVEVLADAMQPFTTGFSCDRPVDLAVALEPVRQAIPRAAGPLARAAAGAPAGVVTVAGREFVVDGRPFRFIGVNIRGLVHYGDTQTLQWTNEGHRAEQLQAAYDMGVRVVRVFLPSVHATADQTEQRLRSVVNLVRDRFPGLYILPALCNLYNSVDFRIPGDDGFYQRLDPNFPGDLLNAGFFGDGYRQHYLPFVRQMAQAFRNEPIIFAWEIGNELKLNPVTGNPVGDPNVATFINYNLAVAREINQLDPGHLITTGMISTHHAWLHTPDLKRQLYASPLIDFITVHCYNDEYVNDDSKLADELKKPFIVEEAGYGRAFGADRRAKVAEDMKRWFNNHARGYMQWGFMGTNGNIGDGDDDSGMDRSLHRDWQPLFDLYRAQAEALKQVDPNWRPEVGPTPGPGPGPAPVRPAESFSAGQKVFACAPVNVRQTPGHLNKPAGDVFVTIAVGGSVTVTGPAVAKDGLTWWPVTATLANGQTRDGWAAQALGSNTLLCTTAPPRSVRRAMDSAGAA